MGNLKPILPARTAIPTIGLNKRAGLWIVFHAADSTVTEHNEVSFLS